jgi:NAD(P)-dependent dehydrogenase (short-subunit alcohol dehydrogenase family)
MYNPYSLENKNILVTGASSGIGRSIAIESSKLGAKVFITGRSEERLLETMAFMKGQNHEFLVSDITSKSEIIKLVDTLPPLNGIVYNAGVIGKRESCKYISTENLDSTISTNLYGPILLQKEILNKKLLLAESSVVFISSRAPFYPLMGNSVYSISKGALLAYAKVLALELASRRIRVNSICPAMIKSEFLDNLSTISNEDIAKDENRYPLQRYGVPEDVAFLAIYLLSDTSKWMTGSSIDITGGGMGSLI